MEHSLSLDRSKKQKIRATVHLDPALSERVRDYISQRKELRLSFSEVVVKALHEYLDSREKSAQ